MAIGSHEFKESTTGESIQDPQNKKSIADAEAKLILFNNVLKNTSSVFESFVKSMSNSIEMNLKDEFEKCKSEFKNYENKLEKTILESNKNLITTLIHTSDNLKMMIQNEETKLTKNIESALLTPFKDFKNEVKEVKKKQPDFEKANPKVEPLSQKLEKAKYDVDTFDKKKDQAKDNYDTKEYDKAVKKYNSSLKKKDQYEAKLNNAGSSYYRYTEDLFKCVSEETHLANCFKDYLKVQTEYHSKVCQHLEEMIPQVQEAINKHPKEPIFNVSIEAYLKKNLNSVSEVIRKLIQLIINKNGLNEEGIFRKSGDQKKVNEFMKAIYTVRLEKIDFNDYSVHDLVSAFKQYLKELPDSILCNDLFNDWDNVFKSSSNIEGYRNVLNKLPPANYENLKDIVKFLSRVNENSKNNKMDAKNIGGTFGMTLVDHLYKNKEKNFSISNYAIDFTTYLISNHNELFPDDNDNAYLRGSSSKSPNSVSEVIRKLIQLIINKNGLNEEGIFSQTGVKSKVDELMKAINSGHLEYIDLNYYSVHDLASAFKQYLRELPDSILCNDLFNDWDNVFKSSSKIEGYKNVLKKLPPANYENLKDIVKFLSRVIDNSENNKMDVKGIGRVFVNNLIESLYNNNNKNYFFLPEPKDYKASIRGLEENGGDLINYLISNYNEIFADDNDIAEYNPSDSSDDSNKWLAKININTTISDDDSDNNNTASIKQTKDKVNSSKKHKTNKKNNKNNNNNNNNNHTEEIINHSVIDDDRRYNEHSIKKVDIIF